MTGAGVGVLATDAWGATEAIAVFVIIALLLIAVVAPAPIRGIRAALAATRAWSPLAQAGVPVRTVVIARRTVPETLKAALVVTTLLGAFFGMTWKTGDISVLLGLAVPLAAAIGLAAVDMSRVARIVGGATEPVIIAACACAALLGLVITDTFVRFWPSHKPLVALTHALVGAPALIGAIAVIVIAAFVYGIGYRRLKATPWGTVTMRLGRRQRTMWNSEPPLPRSLLGALIMIDARRVLRSAPERLRPLGGFSALALIASITLAISWWAGGTIPWPSDVPLREGAAVAAGIIVYLLSLPSSALFALDSDRRAFVLWLSVPGALRRVALVRTASSTAILMLVACPLVVAAVLVLDISDPSTISTVIITAVAAALISSLATVLPSILWPHLGWEETTEIGSVGVWRLAAGAIAPAPIVGVAFAAAALPVPPGAHIALALIAIASVFPLAALATAGVSRRWIRVAVA